MTSVRRSFFTLLELLIVLLILSFGTALTGIKVKEAYEEQRFLAEVEQIVSHLQMAQDLMLILNIDTIVKFSKNDHAISYRIQAEKPSGHHLWAEFLNKEYVLKSIHFLEFEGQSMASTDAALALMFYSQGMVMSNGKLILSDRGSEQEGKKYQIVLEGYPHFIKSEKFKENSRNTASLRDVLTPQLYPKAFLEEPNEVDKTKDNS